MRVYFVIAHRVHVMLCAVHSANRPICTDSISVPCDVSVVVARVLVVSVVYSAQQ